MRHRLPVLSLLALLLLLALPAGALATNASSNGSTVQIVSPPGESAQVSIGATALQKPGVLEVLVSGAPAVAGAGCSAPGSPDILQCTVSGVPTVVVDLGDGDDRLQIHHTMAMRVQANGGDGDDSLFSTRFGQASVPTILEGGPGNDDLSVGIGPDIVRDAAGDLDTLSYMAVTQGPTAITLNGVADDGLAGEGDDIGPGFEQLNGPADGPTTFVGDDAPQMFLGGNAADAIDGGGGNDRLIGGLGDDAIAGGAGDDGLHGRDGNDRLDGGAGDDVLLGHEGDDTLTLRDGAVDTAPDCGPGNDTAVIDEPLDRISPEDGCERVDAQWAGPPVLSVSADAAVRSARRFRLRVGCGAPAGARCKGRLTVRTQECIRPRRPCAKVRVGKARVNLRAGQSGRVGVKVARRARRMVRPGRRVMLRVDVRLAGAAPTRSIVFTNPRRA